MIQEEPPPEALECRGLAEILRDLAAQLRFDNSRGQLISLAERLDRRASDMEIVLNPD